MKQIVQDFKTGEILILDIPAPTVEKGHVLVKNLFSVVSAGTERGTVATAQKNLIGKAQSRPDLVKQVIDLAKKKGIKSTIEKVKSKLNSLKALGYSSAGRVIEVGENVENFVVGDLVACAGSGYASHADVVCVPKNLVSKIPDNVEMKHAAFTTIGSIALQGVRQANVKIGDNVAVIGLGLLGLILIQILKAAGVKVFGADVNDDAVVKGLELGCDAAVNINNQNLLEICREFTEEKGFDSVILAASTKSAQPVEIAGEIARERGNVVVVGAVNMDIPRQIYYEKELEIKLSRSYGPGRYDNDYEEKGIDYPYGYVRWTENRNMKAFIQLIAEGKVKLEPLITHTIHIDDAEKAYELITGKIKEQYNGIVIKYNESHNNFKNQNLPSKVKTANSSDKHIKIGFIGAGSFAQTYLLPELRKHEHNSLELTGVATKHGYTAKKVRDKFNIKSYTTNATEIYSSDNINTIFIATKHNLHSQYLLSSLKNNKNVYLEKPLACSFDELRQVYSYLNSENSFSVFLVGYNRRYSYFAEKMKGIFKDRQSPLVINYRVNAGYLPPNHWTKDKEIGGGRIVGEVCHFIDLITFLTDSTPQKVYAQSINEDTVNISLTYVDNSIAHLEYWSNGNDKLEKEYIEVFCEGQSVILNDFNRLLQFSGKKKHKIASKNGRDIGRKQIIYEFIEACLNKEFPISVESLMYTSLTTFKIEESIRANKALVIDLSELNHINNANEE